MIHRFLSAAVMWFALSCYAQAVHADGLAPVLSVSGAGEEVIGLGKTLCDGEHEAIWHVKAHPAGAALRLTVATESGTEKYQAGLCVVERREMKLRQTLYLAPDEHRTLSIDETTVTLRNDH